MATPACSNIPERAATVWRVVKSRSSSDCISADAAADFLHQLETLIAIDDGERSVVVAGLVRVDGGAQLSELVLDELTKLRQIFDLLRIVARQILCSLQDAGQLT